MELVETVGKDIYCIYDVLRLSQRGRVLYAKALRSIWTLS